MEGAASTTATDVFGLGVVLYELLTGKNPFLEGTQTLREIRRQVRRVDPRPPSQTAGADSWSCSLADDLDAIVLRALRKEPESRYASVEQLAADLLAHLESRPVTARRSTLRYRTVRFLERHRIWMSAEAAITLVVILAGVFMHQKQQELEAEKAKAEATAEFLVGVFEVADPAVNRGATLTANQILERGSRGIEQGFAGQPGLRGAFQTTLGEVYLGMGDYRPPATT